MVVNGSFAALAAQRATATIPIVVAVVNDAVAERPANKVRRPGRNITGFSSLSQTFHPKRLELLKDLLPDIRRVAYLVDRRHPAAAVVEHSLTAADGDRGRRRTESCTRTCADSGEIRTAEPRR
jgi:ABC-type uncharacterized transport system substrate-binding protein